MPQFDTTFFSSLLFWSIVSFGIMLFFLWKVALPRVFEILDARERQIRNSLDEAERQRMEADRRLAEYENMIREATEEAERHMDQARQHAQRLLDDNQVKIKAETDRMLSMAKQEIERGQVKAIQEVRSATVDLAIQLAQRVVERNLSSEDRSRLMNDALQEVEAFYADDYRS